MNVHWASTVGAEWAEALSELTTAFGMSRAAARSNESFVYVVNTDDLLGRRGPTNAMVATGLLSAARTAALEGASKGWTANVVAWDGTEGLRESVETWVRRLLEDGSVNGEVIRVGPGHIGKALP